MSTFRTFTLVITSTVLFGAAIANSLLQTGKGPVNVNGPSTVSAGSSGNSYSVDVANITKKGLSAPGDTYVDITVDNAGFHPSVSTLRIPAGANTGYFSVNVDSNATGTCHVHATNANGDAYATTTVN